VELSRRAWTQPDVAALCPIYCLICVVSDRARRRCYDAVNSKVQDLFLALYRLSTVTDEGRPYQIRSFLGDHSL